MELIRLVFVVVRVILNHKGSLQLVSHGFHLGIDFDVHLLHEYLVLVLVSLASGGYIPILLVLILFIIFSLDGESIEEF